MSAHPVPIELLEEFHLLEVGTTRSGKTYLLRGLLAMLYQAGRRVGAVDKLGNHWGLTRSLDGKGPGLDFFIFGGKHGHLPMQPSEGAQIGRLFVERSIPAIFDVSQWKLHEQQRWVADFCDAVFEANYGRGPLHLSLDEAQSWAPQGTSSLSTDSVRRLAEQGAGNGILLILAVQRLARLDISVRNLAQAVIALRQGGVADRRALRDLVEADLEDAKAFDAALPRLATGEGFLWTPGEASLVRTQFPANTTFDSSRTPKHGDVAIAPAPAISKLVEELRAALAPPPPPAEDPTAKAAEAYRAGAAMGDQLIARDGRIAELEAELAELQAENASLTEDGVAVIGNVIKAIELLKSCMFRSDDVPAVVADDTAGGKSWSEPPADTQNSNLAHEGEDAAGAIFGERAPAAVSLRKPLSGAAAEMPRMTRKLIDTLAGVYPRSLPIEHVARIAEVGIKSSQWSYHFRAFKASGLVHQLATNGEWQVSPQGVATLGLTPQPGAAAALLAFWRQAFPPSTGNMLVRLVEARTWLDRDDIARRAGLSITSSSVGSGLKELRDHRLVERRQDGAHRAKEVLL